MSRKKIYRNNNSSNSLNLFLWIRHRRILFLTGFTLVEVLLALAILAIGLVSILSVFVVGSQSVRRTLAMTEASFIAQMTFTRCNSIGYGSLPVGSYSWSIENSQGSSIYDDYSRTVTIAQVGAASLNVREVTVRVQGNGVDETFTTYIAKQNP